jgi:hypothetical protein
MVEDNQQYAYFSVHGDFDPAELSARVGVQPTEYWRRGDICPRTQFERKFSRWCLHSRLSRDRELEAHIRDVLAQLDGNCDELRRVSLEFGGCMQLVGYFHRDYPGLHFERDITEGLARYSLAVDFDFYGLYSHRREDT